MDSAVVLVEQAPAATAAGTADARALTANCRALLLAREAGRPMRQKEFLAAGIRAQDLANLVRKNLLVRVSRGCYRLPPESKKGDWAAFAAATLRWPGAVVCGPSAAAFHGLLSKRSHGLWLAVLRGHGRPRGTAGGLTVNVREWLAARMAKGISATMVDGTEVRIVDPAYAVAELFELANRIGENLANEAQRKYLARGGRQADIDAARRHINAPQADGAAAV